MSQKEKNPFDRSLAQITRINLAARPGNFGLGELVVAWNTVLSCYKYFI